MDQKACQGSSSEKEAIKQLRNFYQSAKDTQLGSFWEDVIEEIIISNQKSIMKMKKAGEYLTDDWFDNLNLYRNIQKIINIEGGEQDIAIFDSFKGLYEQICKEESVRT